MSQPQAGVLHDRQSLAIRVGQLGAEITRDFSGVGELTVIGVLAGSFIFMADLVREIALPLRCEFLQVRASAGGAILTPPRFLLDLPLEGRAVLVIEDILDSGETLSRILPEIARRGPARLACCVLLDKPSGRTVAFQPDYVGFSVPDEWIIGYGLDDAQLCRNLPYLTSVVRSA